MVIHEKALVRQMKEAYKGWGYTVIVRPGDKWVFKADGWMVQIDGQSNVPNEVLALIELHMGELPRMESACRIYKTDTGPAIQKEVFAVVNEELEKLEELTRQSDAEPVLVQRTKLRYGNCRVWQKEEDMGILLMDPTYTQIIDSKDDIRVVGVSVYAEGDISCVYVQQELGAGEKVHIDHLAQMQW